MPAQNMPNGNTSITLCPLQGCLRVVRVEQSGGDRGRVHSGIVACWRLQHLTQPGVTTRQTAGGVVVKCRKRGLYLFSVPMPAAAAGREVYGLMQAVG